jgi:hypothetical protein
MARTFILAWVIGLLGLIMIGGGIWGVIDLFRQAVGSAEILWRGN